MVETLADQDWERVWLDEFRPMRFGARLWVCPEGMEVDADEAVVVRLDPGLAFGTGTHPTTAMCLEWLDSIDLENKSVLDYGCGSGILGIAAALLGAARSGKGRDVDVSLYDVAIHQLSYPATWYLNEGEVTGRRPRSGHPSVVPCETLPTKDGWVFVMCVLPKFWRALADAPSRILAGRTIGRRRNYFGGSIPAGIIDCSRFRCFCHSAVAHQRQPGTELECPSGAPARQFAGRPVSVPLYQMRAMHAHLPDQRDPPGWTDGRPGRFVDTGAQFSNRHQRLSTQLYCLWQSLSDRCDSANQPRGTSGTRPICRTRPH